MKKWQLVVLVAAVGAVSAAFGSSATLWYLSRDFQQNFFAKVQFNAASNILLLKSLRANHIPDAQLLLEGYLDSSVLTLYDYAREGGRRSDEAFASL